MASKSGSSYNSKLGICQHSGFVHFPGFERSLWTGRMPALTLSQLRENTSLQARVHQDSCVDSLLAGTERGCTLSAPTGSELSHWRLFPSDGEAGSNLSRPD